MCTMCHSTHVIPFRVDFVPGIPVFEQVVYAAKKAIVSGRIRPGAAFPSVRAISKELKINPNTAHKVVLELTAEGLLAVLPGIGTLVAGPTAGTPAERKRLLEGEIERLVVEAKKVGLELDLVLEAVAEHWETLRDQQMPKEPEKA